MQKWLDTFKRSFKQFLADDCVGLAQQVAYSSLLAFFPAMAFLIGALGLFDLFDDAKTFLDPIAPSGVMRFITTLQRDSGAGTSAAAFFIGFVLALWAASGAMGSVIKAVNRAHDRPETRPIWRVRLTAVLLVILSGVTTAGLFLLIVVGGPIGEAIASKTSLGDAWNLLWGIARWPIAFVAVLMFFALVYYLGPNNDKRRWRWVSPGSLVGAILWLVLSGLFALYATFAGNFSKTYGTLASGVILLLWLNYSAVALLFGAELNSELERAGGTRPGKGR